jgi:hypothetical protein
MKQGARDAASNAPPASGSRTGAGGQGVRQANRTGGDTGGGGGMGSHAKAAAEAVGAGEDDLEMDLEMDLANTPIPVQRKRKYDSTQEIAGARKVPVAERLVPKGLAGEVLQLQKEMNRKEAMELSAKEFAAQFVLEDKNVDVETLTSYDSDNFPLTAKICDFWQPRPHCMLSPARFSLNKNIFQLALCMMIPFAGKSICRLILVFSANKFTSMCSVCFAFFPFLISVDIYTFFFGLLFAGRILVLVDVRSLKECLCSSSKHGTERLV